MGKLVLRLILLAIFLAAAVLVGAVALTLLSGVDHWASFTDKLFSLARIGTGLVAAIVSLFLFVIAIAALHPDAPIGEGL